jgi:tetraacyldisaccharide 4'-kinase
MREPSFWWQEPGTYAGMLAPFAALYGAIAARRMAQPGANAPIPVICVGNFTLGGTGKTPAAIAIAKLLIAKGERPCFLTRGYGGHLAGPVRVDAKAHSAADVGDEPLLLARIAPAIVARDRAAGAAMAQSTGANVVVMDDGLQNPSLAKNLALAVVDGRRGIGNGYVFPAGPLRAPLAAQLERIHALVVIGKVSGAANVIAAAAARKIPVFHAALEPDRAALAPLARRKVLAFAGIGDPDKFFATLKAAGIDAPVQRAYPDHHRYTAADAAALVAEAERHDLLLLTTEKDRARMAGDNALAALLARSQALPVALMLEDESGFEKFAAAKIARGA